MKYRPYPKYKDSGVEWLGEIPEGWKILKLKFGSRIEMSNIDKHSVDGEPAVFLCNYTDVYRNPQITADMQFMEATASEDQIKRLTLNKGDVIITKDSETPDDIGIPAYVVETKDNLVCGYHLCLIQPNLKVFSGQLLYWFFSSHIAKAYFFVESVGMTRFALGKYSIANSRIPLPALHTQYSISNFLNTETALIDGLIKDYEELISLLQEKRQALISHAVTRGLSELVSTDDPEFGDWAKPVKFKDSGVEWLGEIPEGWGVIKTSYAYATSSGTTPQTGEEKWYGGNIPWITTGELREGVITETEKCVTKEAIEQHSALKIVPSNSLIIAMYGATIGRLARNSVPATMNQACCALVPTPIATTEFAFFYFQIAKESLILLSSGGGQSNISQEKIRSFSIPLPPIQTQNAISAFLKRESAKLDTLIAEAESAIALLKEHRAALITNAVTGKINVEDYAPIQSGGIR